MDQNTLQSYFESLCNSFYIVYEELKRLEKEQRELEETNSKEKEELEEELELLKVLSVFSGKNLEKYVTQNCSKEELQKNKEKLEVDIKECIKKYKEKKKKLERLIEDIEELYRYIKKAVAEVIYLCRRNKSTVVVQSEKEIIAIMDFFRDHQLSKNNVINISSKLLQSSENEMHVKFIKAYEEMDEEEIEYVCSKLYD